MGESRKVQVQDDVTNIEAELLPHTERVEIPGASHMMHEDNAAVYNAAGSLFDPDGNASGEK